MFSTYTSGPMGCSRGSLKKLKWTFFNHTIFLFFCWKHCLSVCCQINLSRWKTKASLKLEALPRRPHSDPLVRWKPCLHFKWRFFLWSTCYAERRRLPISWKHCHIHRLLAYPNVTPEEWSFHFTESTTLCIVCSEGNLFDWKASPSILLEPPFHRHISD